VYLVVKVGKKSLCGARFILDEPTDNKTWPDEEVGSGFKSETWKKPNS